VNGGVAVIVHVVAMADRDRRRVGDLVSSIVNTGVADRRA